MSDKPLLRIVSGRSDKPSDPRSAAAGKHNLPAMSTRVVGRDEVIDLLEKEVRRSRLVSIVGAGGIGKTTVALAVADRAIGAFRDGIWLVDLAPLRDPSLVPHVIASAMGLVVHSANVIDALCRFARERQILIVLDNCEHLVSVVARTLEQILRNAPGVRVLTTGRVALRMQSEQVHRLAGLASPADSAGLTAANALAYPAIELFVDRATDRLESFVLDDDNAPVIADICRSLDGIALAIELAAMRVDVFGVKGLQKQLNDRFRVLAGRRAGLERHRALAATLDWSYSLLPESEARLLRAVSVFPGAFRSSGASSVASIESTEAAAALMELASKSLLSIEVDAVDTGYRLLETTRAYAQDRLVATGEDLSVRQRHAEHVCAVLERAADEWGKRLSRDWAAAYGSYIGDLRSALAWTCFKPALRSLQIRLTAAGTLLWNHFSLTEESRVHLTRAIAELGDAGYTGAAIEMHLQFALAGAILYTLGIVPEARAAMRRALEISERLGDTDFRLRCLRLLGTYDLFNGAHDAGIRTLQTFLAIARTEDPSAIAEGETHLSVGEMFIGQLSVARKRMERLHAQHSQDFNDARFARFQYSNSINVLAVLSHVQSLTGFPDAALRTAETILEYGRLASHELSLSIALVYNSLLYFWLGREDDCAHHVAMLDELLKRHSIDTWRPVVTFCRGALTAIRQPGNSDGVDSLRRAIAEFHAIGHMARLPFYQATLAQALGKSDRLQEAEATIQQAMALAMAQNEQWCVPEILRIQASIAAARGRREITELLLLDSIAASKKIGALTWQLRSANDLALLWRDSRRVEAKCMLRSAYEAFDEGFGIRDLVVAAALLSELG